MRRIKKPYRVDMMAVLKNHETRVTILEQLVFSLLHKLSAAANENAEIEGGIDEQEVVTAETTPGSDQSLDAPQRFSQPEEVSSSVGSA